MAINVSQAGATPDQVAVRGDRIVLLATLTPPASPLASPVLSVVVANAQLQAACGLSGGGPVGNIGRMLDPIARPLKDAGGATYRAAGPLTLALARGLFFGADYATQTSSKWPRCQTRITPRGTSATGAVVATRAIWGVDWNVDASGRPTLVITASYVNGITASAVSPMVAVVEIQFCGSLGGR